ncbi:MAG: dTMP kinase [Actinomycetota bacterium]
MAAYIAFEGGEGSGKSTQAARLGAALDAVVTREPGGTPLGGALRGLLLDADSYQVGPRAEALMMAADRAQHLQDVVLPALSAGRHVVSDRSAFSSLAYQGAGRELGIDAVKAVNEWAVYGRWPDLVVYLRVDRSVASSRLRRSLDRFEQEGDGFHTRVHDAFDRMAAEDPERWLIVDGDGSVDEVADRILAAVEQALGRLG